MPFEIINKFLIHKNFSYCPGRKEVTGGIPVIYLLETFQILVQVIKFVQLSFTAIHGQLHS